MQIETGANVYVPDKDQEWLPATILSVLDNASKLHVRLQPLQDQFIDKHQELERTVDLSREDTLDALPLQNAIDRSSVGVDDLCTLHYLHEPAVLYNVRSRFYAFKPYTYTGDIVIATNPYQRIPKLYTPEVRTQYFSHARSDLPPHIYATSASAYKNLAQHGTSQSILVSGESGAGKTETVKILMEHLASMSVEKHASEKHDVVDKVLKSNPLLEAFGNAKTVRNDNSSRFGKFTQLQFDRHQKLVGAQCRHYLLEKSRVVAQAPQERNYHIFYQLVAANPSCLRLESHETASYFRYLNDETVLVDGLDDINRFQITCDALTTIGLGSDDQVDLFQALCGILRLGQVDFQSLASGDASAAIGALNDDQNTNGNLEYLSKQRKEIEQAATLLGVPKSSLGEQLCSRSVHAGQDVYAIPLSADDAANNRDGLAKELYARLFAYLVSSVNASIGTTDYRLHIDLLDIFGFESFRHNSFEQFCINFANEKLQQKFTRDVFASVQDEYIREGLQWKYISYVDNAQTLDLLEGSMGLLALLNEESVRPKGSDASFASKSLSVHEGHAKLHRDRLDPRQFIVRHYAGDVAYDTLGFVEKNKDTVQEDLLELVATSSNPLLAQVFQNETNRLTEVDYSSMRTSVTRGSASNRNGSSFMQKTVSYKFRAQLNLLVADIAETETQYIRCVKPNGEKRMDEFDMKGVAEQLRCAGVVEAVRISRAAFPNKLPHEQFLRRFLTLRNGKPSPLTFVYDACEALAKQLIIEDDDAFVMGKTLIYFRTNVLETLESRRTVFLHANAAKIQQCQRRHVARRRRKQIILCITQLQSLYRGHLVRRRYKERRTQMRAATRIQSTYRRYTAERKYQQSRHAATRIQSIVKRYQQTQAYRALLASRREQARMDGEVDKVKKRLGEKKSSSMDDSQTTERTLPNDTLLDDSERVIDYLKEDTVKLRKQVEGLSEENVRLKAENRKLQHAYKAANSTFVAMKERGKQQSQSNRRLMTTHVSLIRVQEEKMKKYQRQIAELKEELSSRSDFRTSVHSDRAAKEMLRVAVEAGVSEHVIEKMGRVLEGGNTSIYEGPKVIQTGYAETTTPSGRNGHDRDAVWNPSLKSTDNTVMKRPMIDTVMNAPRPSYVSTIELDERENGGIQPTYNSFESIDIDGVRHTVASENPRDIKKKKKENVFKRMFKKD